MPTLFPFTAIVGQDRLKRALILNAVSPAIGGVLIRGERGTAKSTAARALAQLLPDIQVVADCPFACDPNDPAALCDLCRARVTRGETLPVATRRVPFVDLPVSATEDRVVGTLDMERAIQAGERRFEPGLLAAAHRGILYIDEVNLLDDHVVDILLDAAAMGVNVVEREGISFSHPARFILIGTMNPEEGELRPQLLDRFALMVTVQGLLDPAERAEVIARRLRYEAAPDAFYRGWIDEEARLAACIAQARDRLAAVAYTDADLRAVAGLTASYRVPGHRADLAILKTALAQAALDGRPVIGRDDIVLGAELALPHRLRQDPLHEAELDGRAITARLADLPPHSPPPPRMRGEPDRGSGEGQRGEGQRPRESQPVSRAADGQGDGDREAPPEAGEPALAPPALPSPAAEGERRIAPGAEFHARRLTTNLDHLTRRAVGRRSLTRTDRKRGRYVASRPAEDAASDLALDATLRAAAPHQARRRALPPPPVPVHPPPSPRPALLLTRADLRRKVRTRRVGNLILFAVDASWSVSAAERMAATKGAVLSLLRDAYQRRDRVGLLVFRRDRADLVLPFTNSVERARRALVDLPIGGKTPLPAALLLAGRVFETARRVEPGALPLLILLTDGVGNVPLTEGRPVDDEVRMLASRLRRAGVHSVVIDSEGGGPDAPAARLAEVLGGHFLTLPQLHAETLAAAVRGDEVGD